MTLGCMILYDASISRLTKSFMLRTIFQKEDIEIEVIDAATTVIYLNNVKREKVWQATLDFESANLTTVYSFAETKNEAFHLAMEYLSHLHTVR